MKVSPLSYTRALVCTSFVLWTVGCDRPESASGPVPKPAFAAITPSASVATGSLVSGRSAHVAVRLANGQVLVAGGMSGTTRLASAELFDPAGLWSATQDMNHPRLGHAAVLLADGQVLVVGGSSSNTCPDPVVGASAELYDPVAKQWILTGSAAVARINPAIALLANGKVLLAGGSCGSVTQSAELYDPATGVWTSTGSMATARGGAAAVRLGDGRVLVAGGVGASFGSLASAELYDPGTGTWSATGSMNDPRIWMGMLDMSASGLLVLLPDGRVLTTGGVSRTSPFDPFAAVLTTAELYNPASGAWTRTGDMARARMEHQMAVLTNGSVLVTGGRDFDVVLNTLENFDPATGLFQAAAPLLTARYDHTATLLADGRVLVAAGQNTAALSSAELFGASQANRPPVANAGPGVSGFEGSAVAFDGSASSDPDGDVLTYSWDFGDKSTPGTDAKVSHVYQDDGVYTVTLTVSDGKLSSNAITTATIANVAPAVGAFAGATLAVGATYMATGSFTDPGADIWTATVDYGDGSGVQPLALVRMGFNLSHVYTAAGSYPVTVTVTDDEGGSGVGLATVVVQQPPQDVCDDDDRHGRDQHGHVECDDHDRRARWSAYARRLLERRRHHGGDHNDGDHNDGHHDDH